MVAARKRAPGSHRLSTGCLSPADGSHVKIKRNGEELEFEVTAPQGA